MLNSVRLQKQFRSVLQTGVKSQLLKAILTNLKGHTLGMLLSTADHWEQKLAGSLPGWYLKEHRTQYTMQP